MAIPGESLVGSRRSFARKEVNKTMAKDTKIVKGGFRATLALIISIIALILSIVAYTSTMREDQFNARIKEMQTSMDRMKQESSKQIDKLRDETGKALEKLGNVVKKKEGAREEGAE